MRIHDRLSAFSFQLQKNYTKIMKNEYPALMTLSCFEIIHMYVEIGFCRKTQTQKHFMF